MAGPKGDEYPPYPPPGFVGWKERALAAEAEVASLKKVIAERELREEVEWLKEREKTIAAEAKLAEVEQEAKAAISERVDAIDQRDAVERERDQLRDKLADIFHGHGYDNGAQAHAEALAEKLADLVAAIDAECVASKVWYESRANSEIWDQAGKNREIAIEEARSALAAYREGRG